MIPFGKQSLKTISIFIQSKLPASSNVISYWCQWPRKPSNSAKHVPGCLDKKIYKNWTIKSLGLLCISFAYLMELVLQSASCPIKISQAISQEAIPPEILNHSGLQTGTNFTYRSLHQPMNHYPFSFLQACQAWQLLVMSSGALVLGTFTALSSTCCQHL